MLSATNQQVCGIKHSNTMTNQCQGWKIPRLGQGDFHFDEQVLCQLILIDVSPGAIRCSLRTHLHHCTKLFDGFTQLLSQVYSRLFGIVLSEADADRPADPLARQAKRR